MSDTPEMIAAIRAGCELFRDGSTPAHCEHPACGCAFTPNMARTAIAAYEAARPPAGVVSYLQALGWAITTFGSVAAEPRERALRFVEEAIEVAHVMALSPDDLQKIISRVWSKPPGEPPVEIAQAALTLGCLGEVLGVRVRDAEAVEFARIQAVPKEEWARRHSAKVALGIATAPPEDGNAG